MCSVCFGERSKSGGHFERIATIFSEAGNFGLNSIQRVVSEDEKSTAIGSAKYQIDRPIRNIDSPQELSVRVIDKDLFGREVDISILILRYSFSSVLRKERGRTRGPIGLDIDLVSPLIGLVRNIDRVSGNRTLETEGVQYIGQLRTPA